jgi:alpha-1,6-mannosyltransferase
VLLNLFIPFTILLHLLVAPYTKVEESFNIQAIHDIVNWEPAYFPSVQRFDHIEFSGAVPRTFVGAVIVAALSKPFSYILGSKYWALHAQFIVRAILGLLNAAALLMYKNGLEKSFGKNVGRWWVLFQGSQFHVMFYASRTLPNMFALGLSECYPTCNILIY